MSRHQEMCPHCRGKAGLDEMPAAEAQEIVLPAVPTLIRVHHDGRAQDCTLHPDGSLTAVMAGQVWRSALSFDEMRERNWAGAHIEFDPQPLEAEPEPEAAPVAEQIPLAA